MQSQRPPPASGHYFNLYILGGRGLNLHVYNLSYQLAINLQVVIQLYVAVANGVFASQQEFY